MTFTNDKVIRIAKDDRPFLTRLLEPKGDRYPHNMCSCDACGGCFRGSTLDFDYEDESWEEGGLRYLFHICPVCVVDDETYGDGEIGFYWYSRTAAVLDRIDRQLTKLKLTRKRLWKPNQKK